VTIRRPLVAYRAGLFLVLMASLTCATAQDESRSLTTLYNFQGAYGDGGGPVAGVLYGSTEGGGDNAAIGCRGVFGCGIIFSLAPPPGGPTASAAMWNETVLYSFTGGSDGSFPTGLAVRNGKVVRDYRQSRQRGRWLGVLPGPHCIVARRLDGDRPR